MSDDAARPVPFEDCVPAGELDSVALFGRVADAHFTSSPDVGDDCHDAVRPRVDDEEIVTREVPVIVRRNGRKADDERPRHGDELLPQARR